jgi:hypothetical protein
MMKYDSLLTTPHPPARARASVDMCYSPLTPNDVLAPPTTHAYDSHSFSLSQDGEVRLVRR